MTTQTLGLEDLLRLIDDLRLAGYGVGTRQYVDAQRLLIALAAHGRHPQRPLDLCPYLAPVLCSTPKEQENFYKFFPQWLARQPHLAQDSDRPSRPEQGAGAESPGGKKPRVLSARVLLVIAAVAVLLFAYPFAVWLDGATTRNVSGVVVRQGDNAAVTGARVAFRRRADIDLADEHDSAVTDAEGNFAFTYRVWQTPASLTVTHEEYDAKTHPLDAASSAWPVVVTLTPAATGRSLQSGEEQGRQGDENQAAAPVLPAQAMPAEAPAAFDARTFYRRLRWAALLLPPLLFAAWWLRRFYRRRRMLLRRARSARRQPLEHLTVRGVTEQLFQGQAFRRTVQELRRHRPRGSRELDEQTTIEATIRRGGLFTPFYGSRRTLPEYLVLIDRLSPGDQLARFQEELVRRLAQDSLNLDTYYFRGDPRICRRKMDDATHPATYLTLPDLAALHPDYYLLIFGDGAGFIDPVTGKPERWLEQFSPWDGRAIMTPESPAFWRFREWTLRESDFLILPAGREGLASLGEAINAGTPHTLDDQHPRTLRRFPEMLRDWPRRWLEDHEPSPEEAERLVEQLAIYLGPDGMNWLAACAVYPALRWDITLYLGFELFPDGEEFERTLLSLVSLLWLRHGMMPDWLRTALVSSLSPPDERAVRRALENLLVTALDAPPDGVRLDYSTRRPEPGARGDRGLRRRLREWLQGRGRRATLRGILGLAPEGSPLHDFVFLTFLSGRRPRRIDLNIPDALRRVLFPRGFKAYGLRPAAVLTGALLFSLAGWAALGSFEPRPRPEQSTRDAAEARPAPPAPPATPPAGEDYALRPGALLVEDWPTIRFDFSIERTDVAGGRGARFTSLRASDVRVALDQEAIQVRSGDLTGPRVTDPVGVLILLDETGSMMGGAGGVNKIAAVKNAVGDFIDSLKPSDVVGLVGFGDSTNVIAKPTSDKRILRNALELFGPRYGRNTRLYDAVEYGLEQAGAGRMQSLIVITDGLEDSPDLRNLNSAALAEYKRRREQRITRLERQSGVSVYTITISEGLGAEDPKVDRVSLSNIAEGSNGGKAVYIDLPPSNELPANYGTYSQRLLTRRLTDSLEEIGQSLHDSYSLTIRLDQLPQPDGKLHFLNLTFSVGTARPVLLSAQFPIEWKPAAIPTFSDSKRPPAHPLFAAMPDAVTRAELVAVYAGATAMLATLALFPTLARRVSRRRRARIKPRKVETRGGSKSESWKKWVPGTPYLLASVCAIAFVLGGAVWKKWLQGPSPELSVPTPQPTSESVTSANPPVPANMVYVPGGDFIMGRDDGDEYERPAHRVTVRPFYIDAYEVTCEEYKKFMDATGHAAPTGWRGGNYPMGSARKPVNGVSWEDANAFAKWAGKRLPTEEEWEYAARGTDERRYPWGNVWGEGLANADASNGPADVGSDKGVSPFGAYDMVGNVWEWTSSEPKAYPGGLLPAQGGGLRVIRGGMWLSRPDTATTTYRRGWPVQNAPDYSGTGFRLVKDIE